MTSKATITVDTRRTIADIDPLIFGGFAEHLGRCVYEGIYDPESPHADVNGLRKDVMAALREIGFTTIRYPGGNFVSGYDWMDGVGPKDLRPRRLDLAWYSVETNQFGTDEFMQFCKEVNTEPMMAVNLGTGPMSGAQNLVEYCNSAVGTKYADLRATNGHKAPYNVKYWCLGNEMDGDWQIGHLEAPDYGRKAHEAAKLMKWVDPSIKTILCGSSGSTMPTYPEWDRVSLEHCYNEVEYLSIHRYVGNQDNDTPSFLQTWVSLEKQVDDTAATIRYVKAKKRSKKDVFISWDEWNVWYKAGADVEGWPVAPAILEEVYNLEDALVVATWLNVFLRKSAVVRMACLAQIVNVIGPILTKRDGMLKQSIFYPLVEFTKAAKGEALDLLVNSPMVETKQYGNNPALDVSASVDPETGKQAFFIVNTSTTDAIPVEIEWVEGAPKAFVSGSQMTGTDPKLANTWENPNAVTMHAIEVPRLETENGRTYARFSVPPMSFTVLAG